MTTSDMPAAFDAEVALLGALLDGTCPDDAWWEIRDRLSADDFGHGAHSALYAAITARRDADKPSDLTGVTAALRASGELEAAGGVAGITEILEACVPGGDVLEFADLVRGSADRRRLIVAADQAAQLARDGRGGDAAALDRAESVLADAAERRHRSEDRGEGVGTIARRVIARADEAFERKGEGMSGLATGFRGIDDILRGLRPGGMYVIAGRPSMGKSSFASSIVLNVLRQGAGVLFVSLEVSRDDVVAKVAAAAAEVSFHAMETGGMSDDEHRRFAEEATWIGGSGLIVDDATRLPVTRLAARVRAAKGRGVELVVVDHIGLLDPGEKKPNREQEVSAISRAIKATAVACDLPVIALSQLNRGVESRPLLERAPRLGDLRDSGAVEQDADAVLAIMRPSYYASDRTTATPCVGPDPVRVEILKNRAGRLGLVTLDFHPAQLRFAEREPDFGFLDGPVGAAEVVHA